MRAPGHVAARSPARSTRRAGSPTVRRRADPRARPRFRPGAHGARASCSPVRAACRTRPTSRRCARAPPGTRDAALGRRSRRPRVVARAARRSRADGGAVRRRRLPAGARRRRQGSRRWACSRRSAPASAAAARSCCHDLLAPHAGRNLLTERAWAALGRGRPAARAASPRRAAGAQHAAEHFARALELNRRWGSETWWAHSVEARATWLPGSTGEEADLRRASRNRGAVRAFRGSSGGSPVARVSWAARPAVGGDGSGRAIFPWRFVSTGGYSSVRVLLQELRASSSATTSSSSSNASCPSRRAAGAPRSVCALRRTLAASATVRTVLRRRGRGGVPTIPRSFSAAISSPSAS